MKRVLLHLAFWLVYLFQDVLLIFLVDSTVLEKFPLSERIMIAVLSCLVSLIPKLLFTYFMLYVTLKRITGGDIHLKRYVIYSLLLFLACVFIYRGLVVYFIDPVVYHWTKNIPPYFDLLGFLVALMDIGFASGAAIVIKQIRIQLAAKDRERNLVREKLEAELKFLRNQTNPHFLFNTLNNIYALARKKSDETPAVVMKLSQLLRFMLYETKKTTIKIGDEVRMLDDYIELEKIRYGQRITIGFVREMDNDGEPISPLLLLPFVENAFKHGAGESRFASCIQIYLRLQNGRLAFRIENTKESSGPVTVSENIGLGNVRRQLELMYRDYDLQVQNETTLFKVCLIINLRSHATI